MLPVLTRRWVWQDIQALCFGLGISIGFGFGSVLLILQQVISCLVQ